MSRGAAVTMHGLDLLSSAMDFFQLLKDTKRDAQLIQIRSFERDFGEIRFPDMIASSRENILQAQWEWLLSTEGKKSTNQQVCIKIAEWDREGKDVDRILQAGTLRTVRHMKDVMAQDLARLTEQSRKASRCPSDKHGFGEGPCTFSRAVDGKWGH